MILEAERAGLRYSLVEFINSKGARNTWIYTNKFKIYVRRGFNKDRFWLASIDVLHTGQGTFKNVILPTVEAVSLESDYRALIVENVQTEQFAAFFRKHGWIETTDGLTSTFTLHLRP